MKICISFALIFVLNTFQSFGQSDTVITLISERHIKLNGGARSQVGGKSRTYIKVDLPQGTKSWYYSYSTYSNQYGTQALNLGIQLMGLVAYGGSYSDVASLIEVPAGTATGDVYLLDGNNVDDFISKVDNYGGTFTYWSEGSVFNTKNAVVAIDDLTSGTYYLGLKNPGTWDALDIHIEVVAIVDNSNEGTWTPEYEDLIYDALVEDLTEEMEFETATEVAACMVEYIVSNYTLEQAASWTEAEQRQLEEQILLECFVEDNECENKSQADTYGNLGWTYFEKGDFSNTIKYSKKALEVCPQHMAWVEANIGLSYLVQDSVDMAIEFYVQAIASSKESKFGKEYLSGALDDLETYSDKYPIIGRHPEIMDLLMLELE